MKKFNEWLKEKKQAEQFIMDLRKGDRPEQVAAEILSRTRPKGRQNLLRQMEKLVKRGWLTKGEPEIYDLVQKVKAQVLDPVALHGPEAAQYRWQMSGVPSP